MTFATQLRRFGVGIAALGFVTVLAGCATTARKAERLAQAGDTASARQLLQEALVKDSTNVSLWRALATLEDTTGHSRQAARAYRHVLQLQPEDREARQGLVRSYLAVADSQLVRGNRPAARDTIELALKVDSTCGTCWEKLGDTYLAIDFARTARGYYEKAVATGDSSARAKLDSTTARIRTARRLASRGEKLYAKGRWSQAVRILEKAQKLDAENDSVSYTLHMSRGRLLYKRGGVKNLWAAISEFGHAAALRPNAAEPHYWLARTYHKKDKNEFVNEIEEYQKAAKLEPNTRLGKLCARKARELKAWKKKLDDFWGRKP